jgi:hypothetical protein
MNRPNPSADRVVSASWRTIERTAGIFAALTPMTIRPPARYRPTFSGDSFAAARPIDLMPPMITSHVSTATAIPMTTFGIPKTLLTTSAIEFGCVNGVVVSAATAATNAKVVARNGDFRPSRR